MRIVIDIDGTICELKKENQSYSNLRVNYLAVEKIKELKSRGHYIILQTARHMKTCGGNLGRVNAKVGLETLKWLENAGIPYDEIFFGKPYGDIYIDDLNHKFTSWESINSGDYDDNLINILIPMAGKGSRFQEAGYTLPKPLIEVKGKTMIEWAMQSFSFLKKYGVKHRLIFVVQEAHEEKFKIKKNLRNLFGKEIVVITINKYTRGQAETCLYAKKYINNYCKLIIHNCDTYSISNIEDYIEKGYDGIIPCFKTQDKKYSFARDDEYGFVDKVAEKDVISDRGSVGMYYFRRGSDFVSTAESMLDRNAIEKSEFYVAPCYNELIKSGKRIKSILVKKNWIMGTPEELEIFAKKYKK